MKSFDFKVASLCFPPRQGSSMLPFSAGLVERTWEAVSLQLLPHSLKSEEMMPSPGTGNNSRGFEQEEGERQPEHTARDGEEPGAEQPDQFSMAVFSITQPWCSASPSISDLSRAVKCSSGGLAGLQGHAAPLHCLLQASALPEDTALSLEVPKTLQKSVRLCRAPESRS